ncbi:hypothetical protein XAC2852_270011 [Xanthomonas citri pv. citri]|nr:hypothetical protein XAC2852_270011 [Xanthomonas citri pv. citri]
MPDESNDCTADETAAQRCASSSRVAFLVGAGCHAVGLLQALVHRIVELREIRIVGVALESELEQALQQRAVAVCAVSCRIVVHAVAPS